MTIYLFKAFADVFMMLPLTLWTGDERSFMATVLLYAISNGVELYDLCYKKEATEYKIVKYITWVSVICVAILALISCACMMHYLEIQVANDVKDAIITIPSSSFLSIPDIRYTSVLKICALPIATHLAVFVSKHIHNTIKAINNYLVK